MVGWYEEGHWAFRVPVTHPALLPLAGARSQNRVLLACLGVSVTEDELASLKQDGEKDIEVTNHRLTEISDKAVVIKVVQPPKHK